MAETFIVDASPLIFLSRAEKLGLLHHLASKVLVTETVALEIRQKGHDDPTVRALESTPWLESISDCAAPAEIIAWGLGAGESSVRAVAFKQSNFVAVVDDLAARRCAFALDIPVRGTLGIVLVAKTRGLIPSARSVMEDLIRTGLHLSKSVLDDALSRVGE